MKAMSKYKSLLAIVRLNEDTHLRIQLEYLKRKSIDKFNEYFEMSKTVRSKKNKAFIDTLATDRKWVFIDDSGSKIKTKEFEIMTHNGYSCYSLCEDTASGFNYIPVDSDVLYLSEKDCYRKPYYYSEARRKVFLEEMKEKHTVNDGYLLLSKCSTEYIESLLETSELVLKFYYEVRQKNWEDLQKEVEKELNFDVLLNQPNLSIEDPNYPQPKQKNKKEQHDRNKSGRN